MINKLRALVGGVALLLVLAACYPGMNSQTAQGYEIQATITKGKVNLTHSLWDSGPEGEGFINPHELQGPWGYPRQWVTSTADVNLNFSNSKGNWNVSGTWIDGYVRMEFTGKSEYLTALLNSCLSNVWMNDVDGQLWYWDIQDEAWGYDFNAEDCGWFEDFGAPGYVEDVDTGVWIKGGCVQIPTMYRSLNSDYIGTGHALLLVCQNDSNEFNPIAGEWNNPSYMEVWIPDTTWISNQAIGDVYYYLDGDEDTDDCWDFLDYDRCPGSEDEYNFQSQYEDNVYYTKGYFENDNSPFRNYYAGGVNTNRSGKWIVQTRYNSLFAPSATMPTEPALFNSSYWFIP